MELIQEKKFYDRYFELKFLREKYENLRKGEFGIIYGRRRMGKSELLRKFVKKVKTKKMYINVIDSNKKSLMNTLSIKINESYKETLKINEWKDFFDYLVEKTKSESLVLIIDEFQRIYEFSKDFVFHLQEYWDSVLKNRKIMIIVCGSSMSMMHKIALEENGPLYGRKTFEYNLKQFRYLDFREMFKEYSEEDKIKIFSIFGGTPKYLDNFKYSNLPLLEGFFNLVLSANGPLYDEPLNALKFELKNPERFVAILRAISEGKVESKEIADCIGFENFEISPYLKNLSELLDMIEPNDPFFGKKRMKRYKIKDNFFRFWYRFVYPYRAHIEIGNTKFISDKINKEFSDYCGRIFEDIVKEFFIFMNGKTIKNKKIDFEDCGKWWGEGEEIDLVLKTKSGAIFIECKFKEKKIGLDCFEELKKKSLKCSAGGKFSYIIISKSGFEQNLIDKKISELLLLDLEDLTKIMDSETKREVEKQEELIKYFDL